MQKWQYHIEKISTEDEPAHRIAEELLFTTLNDSGQDGWELVSCLPAAPNVNPHLYYAIFKRLIEKES